MTEDPYALVRTLPDALPPGSRLMFSHGTVHVGVARVPGRTEGRAG
ncbi:SAM-dependent methyltransferase [Streptomyces silvensis]|nr:SAM-dependent methyltransferase [Streptomyces silvensis]